MNEFQVCQQMTRGDLRKLKRIVSGGKADDASEREIRHSRESALLLLARSIRLGHRRLALIRLNLVISVGASATLDQWNYCEKIAMKNAQRDFLDLFEAAKRRISVCETN